MSATLPNQAPVVIIGGGICGVSTLYHLAKRGVAAVLIERKRLASGTTWHAAGIVGQLRDSGSQTQLAKYTTRLFQSLEDETGQATGYKQNGTINLALNDVRHEQLLRQKDHADRMQVPAHILPAQGVAEHWPDIVIDDVKSALYVPSNGQVNALDVTMALAKGAKALGGQIIENCAVRDLIVHNGSVQGVETDQGTIRAPKVVLAAGMWSHLLGKRHGITVPLHACEHWYIVTEPVEGLPATQPILNIGEERTYWKEDAGKLLIGAFESQGKAYARDHCIPEHFEFDELPFDMDHVAPELARMFSRMPRLETMGIQTFFNGPESFTPDGRPYLGPVNEVNGVFLATGMNSNGILNSGGVGLTMAEWLIDGQPSRSMLPLLATRAHWFQSNTAYNQERAAESVGFHYGLHWPGRQVLSARGVRRVPNHDRLLARGAVMAERIGWEVPMFYDPNGPCDGNGWPRTERASIGWQDWSDLVAQECEAAHHNAVVVDQSMYAKILVQGPDATQALKHVCGAQMQVSVGTSVYTQLLNTRGGIEADITVLRLGLERYLIITGHPSQQKDLAYLARHFDPKWRVETVDMTAAYSLLSIHGPKARAILQSISLDDLSADALGFGAVTQVDLAHARATIIRRSFLGEVGFELLMSTEFSNHVFDAVWRAGLPHDLRAMGMFAMNACRLEKGFRHFGHDIGDEDTVLESGLWFSVDMQKPSFVGRDALARQRADWGAAPPDRLVSVRLVSATAKQGPYLIHNEPVWLDGRIVGHVTSGAWGHRLGAMVGLATLHNARGVSEAWLKQPGFQVQIAGAFHSIEVSAKPFFDPAGIIMRG